MNHMNRPTFAIFLLMAVLAGQAYAVKDFADNSIGYMRQILDEANLANDSYYDNASLRDGYKASDGFLNSPDIGYKYRLADGRTVFTFDRIGEAMSSDDQLLYSYVYNPENGMITPYENDVTKSTVFHADPPNFAAQILEKDGTTYIAFRGSEFNKDDWINTNATQLFGIVPPQFRIADILVQAVQSTAPGPVRLTGHSEGAGEVQYSILRSLERGNFDISGSAFNYQQMSSDVLNLFSRDVRDAAGNVLSYFRVGNDVVSGLSLLGEGSLSEENNLGEACWIGNYLCFRPITAHLMVTVIEFIQTTIERKEGEIGAGAVVGGSGGGVTPDDLDELGDGGSGNLGVPGGDTGGSGVKGVKAHRWGQSK